jgi:phosphoserine aminotransferase
MLAVEDALDGLRWAEEIGGLEELMARTDRNAAALDSWVSSTPWVDYLCQDPGVRSNTSVALVITAPAFRALDDAAQRTTVKRFCALLDDAGAAYDIGAHRDAPPGLRIWCGATVETANLDALFPWLDWAWNQIAAEIEDA